jgi:hypothetical protein
MTETTEGLTLRISSGSDSCAGVGTANRGNDRTRKSHRGNWRLNINTDQFSEGY